MRLISCALSDPGRRHDVNEDFFVADDVRGLYVVSDGVGMYRGAAVASRCVVESIAEELRTHPPESLDDRRRWLIDALKKAAASLTARARRDKGLASMSATLTLVHIVGGEALVMHVGDSRAYLLRGGCLNQLTRDHSLAFEQYEASAITKDQLREHPNQRLLTRTLRPSGSAIPELAMSAIVPGDRLLLCTDGLTKELSDTEITSLISSTPEVTRLAQVLVDRANEAGGRDNVTVVVVAGE